MRYVTRGCGCILVAGLVMFAGVFTFQVAGAALGTSSGGIFSLFTGSDTPVSGESRPVDFEIRSGDDASIVATRLKNAGLIRDERVFRSVATQTGLGGRLSVGAYELSPSMTSREMLTIFAEGRVKTRLVAVPEGWRSGQVLDRLVEEGIGSREAVTAAITAATQNPPAGSLAAARPAGMSLDGYLYPDSYAVAVDSTPNQILEAMLRLMDQQFTPELRAAVAARGLTPHQALTLASIVEREAVKPEERSIIAGVYLNRLKIGMILQADPTVQYAVGNNPASVAKDGYWKKDLTLEDLRIDSPYNTYRYGGLPPAPICNPGIESIKAVANPATHEFIYFVAKPDGSHAFAVTLAEHNANVARYLR